MDSVITRDRLVFRNKTYRRLWIAQTGSGLGDWFNQVAIGQVTLTLTHSPTAMGIVILCRGLPQVFLSTFVGPLIERLSKRAVMLICDLIRALLALEFVWASFVHEIWGFYIGSLLFGVAATFFGPAQSAAIPLIVSSEGLLEANAWSTGTAGVIAIVGALIGGMVSTELSPTVAFTVNALSFVWSAGWILAAHWNENLGTRKQHIRSSYLADLWEGFRELHRNHLVLALILTYLGFALSSGPYFVMIPVLGDLTYHLGGMGIGLLYVADGLAFMVAAVLVNRLGKHLDGASRWYGWGHVIQGSFFVIFALSTNVWVGMTAIFMSQLGSGILMPLHAYLLQRFTHERVRGRIFSIHGTAYSSTMQISLLITGVAIEKLGSPVVGEVVGIVSCLSAAGWWLAFHTKKNVQCTSQMSNQQ